MPQQAWRRRRNDFENTWENSCANESRSSAHTCLAAPAPWPSINHPPPCMSLYSHHMRANLIRGPKARLGRTQTHHHQGPRSVPRHLEGSSPHSAQYTERERLSTQTETGYSKRFLSTGRYTHTAATLPLTTSVQKETTFSDTKPVPQTSSYNNDTRHTDDSGNSNNSSDSSDLYKRLGLRHKPTDPPPVFSPYYFQFFTTHLTT